MNKYQSTKQWLKDQAKKIRKIKEEYKEGQRSNLLTWQIARAKNVSIYEYRHRHIAYSLFRGKTMDQIEKPAPNNLPNMDYINKLVQELEDSRLEENMHEFAKVIRSCA